MCLIISVILAIFGINLLMAGDWAMGTGSLLASLGLFAFMVRHILKIKKERGKLNAKECLSCNTHIVPKEDK